MDCRAGRYLGQGSTKFASQGSDEDAKGLKSKSVEVCMYLLPGYHVLVYARTKQNSQERE
jgi:hypothetical protein